MSFLCSGKTSDPVKPIKPATACQFNIPVSFWVATVAISLEQIILLTWRAIKEKWRFEAISGVQNFILYINTWSASKSTDRKDYKEFKFTVPLIMILIVIRLKPVFEVGLFYKYKYRSHWKGEKEHLTPVIALQKEKSSSAFMDRINLDEYFLFYFLGRKWECIDSLHRLNRY